jgi:hypothetical protein
MLDHKVLMDFFKECSEDFQVKLKKASIVYLLQSDELSTLDNITDDLFIDQFIGFGQGDYVNIGQTFQNPYDRSTYLEVVEYDFNNDRVLLALRTN